MIIRADELLMLEDAGILELEDAEIDQMAGARKRNIVISADRFRALQKQFLLRLETYKRERCLASEN
ncbi:MAG: hypothetical protein K6F95_06080 [Selenomonas sp.]|uniref:hypothetical protein n=1 Tax=Selenomonas sp. TaxID=2053611 RepID=UPI0025FE03C7|nr:hypothetical protein [Selenomonas sp.]MCR5757455.1 hypothetical protein [Selenomonas sp.]